jgi:molybdopterin-containing oxidoreductase family iron-sulfur binding subunit
LFGGITELEVLARIAGVDKPAAYDVVRETFRAISGDNEEAWKKFLHDGFLGNSAAQPASVQLNAASVAQAIAALKPPTTTSRDQLEVVFHRDYRVDDGRYTNNGWLQELPDPITKLTWENVVMVSRKTAPGRKPGRPQML